MKLTTVKKTGKGACEDGCGPECPCHANDHRLERKDRGEILLYDPIPTTIIKKERLGSRHTLLRVKAHADYAPGQFFQLTVLGYGEAPISIASASTEHVDFVINPVGLVTKEAVRKNVGDTLLLRGPYGYGYPMAEFVNKRLLLVGGGCGVAPLKGVLDFLALHRAEYRDVSCYFGYREPKESIFTRELAAWERQGVFSFTYAYSQPQAGFKGNVGFVTAYLEAAKPDPHDTIALVCGPTPMMLSVIKTLNALGFTDEQVWISHERHMKCATGMCGHCMIEGKYTCKDGPVFRWDWIKNAKG